jgi:two-component system chemotaxis response regulator CheY
MFTPQEATLLAELLREKLEGRKGHIAGSDTEVKDKTALVYTSILAKIQHELPRQVVKHPAKVLIVDDIESMRRLNAQIMKGIGFEEVDFASSGRKAQQMMEQAVIAGEPFGLVLVDWEMPNMSGLELLKEVRKDPKLWHTPFFLLTAVTDKSQVIDAIKNGVTGYITKPVSHKSLYEKVKQYL